MHLNVKAKINLILNDFQLILKGNGVELMCKVKRLQFYSRQMKVSLFFPLYSICYFFIPLLFSKAPGITSAILVRVTRPAVQSIFIYGTEHQMGLDEYCIFQCH